MNKNDLPILAFLALGLISPDLSASERPEITPLAAVSPLASSAVSLPPGIIVVTPPLRRAEPAAVTARTEPALAGTEARPLQTAMQVAARSSSSGADFVGSDSSSAAASGSSAVPVEGGMPSPGTGLAAVLLMLCILVGRRNRYDS